MEVKAVLKYLRISPRKIRPIANLLKGLDVGEAEAQLKYLTKRGARHLEKLLHSAVANAGHNFHLDKENLYIANIKVDEGPSLVRYMPRARGAVSLIKKRSSHITLILREKKERVAGSKLITKEKKEKGRSSSEKTKRTKKKQKIVSPRKKETREKKVAPKVVPKHTIFRRKAI